MLDEIIPLCWYWASGEEHCEKKLCNYVMSVQLLRLRFMSMEDVDSINHVF